MIMYPDNITLDQLLESEDILLLRDMCVDFFMSASQGSTYTRRPPLALRLPHEDFVMVVRPTTTHVGSYVNVDNRGVLIECLCEFDGRKAAMWLSLLVTEQVKKRRWTSGKFLPLSIQAAMALVEVAGLFASDPYMVIERNKNNCCCCGRGLTDEGSRARGIGPECMEKIGMVFGRATTHRATALLQHS